MSFTPDVPQFSIKSDVVFWGDGKVKGANARSFEPFNAQWGRDDKAIYNGTSRIRGADHATFEVLNAIFARDANNVYYIMGIAKGIAPGDFEVLDQGVWSDETSGERVYHGYARNSDSVFFLDRMSGKPRVVRGADPVGFERLSYDYGRDRQRAYYYGLQIKGSVPADFRPLDSGYSMDSKRAYYAGEAINGADAATFEIVPAPRGHAYAAFARDSRNVYCIGKILPEANPASFRILDDDYESDGTHHYQWGDPIAELPPDLNA